MAVAGISWGIYSLRGRKLGNPVAATAGNFLKALPFSLVVLLVSMDQINANNSGIILAVLSGALTSGIGYVVWYSVVPKLTATNAAIIQLSVPVLAAIGGAIFLGEMLTARLIISALIILSGIGLAILK